MEHFNQCAKLSHITVIKVAIEICNRPEVKNEILCTSDDINKEIRQFDAIRQWNEKIEKKAMIILNRHLLPEKLKEKVIGVVLAIGLRMRIWAVYHEINLNFSRDYCLRFLNVSFFTQQGIIDNKRTGEVLVYDKNLSVIQRYTLACYYCFRDYIPSLYTQMTQEEKKVFYGTGFEWPRSERLVQFWSYYLIDQVDKMKGEKTVDQFRLEKAIESGSKTAVEYCFENTKLTENQDIMVDAAIEAINNKIGDFDNWFIFENLKFCQDDVWVPSHYYVDIVYYLLSKMQEDQQIEFLKKDIDNSENKQEDVKYYRYSRVLEYFMEWPYQNYFMKTVELMWEFLPERNYAVLLLKLCDKIESEKEKHFKYSERKSYNYRRLLKEFWCQSPNRYKRYVLGSQKVIYVTDDFVIERTGLDLLSRLLSLRNFTCEDEEIIRLILISATDEEKENIISSNHIRSICIKLINENRLGIVERFLNSCFSTLEKANEFKTELIFSDNGIRNCTILVEKELELADRFINSCLFSQKEIKKFKKDLAYKNGAFICKNLIAGYSMEDVKDSSKMAFKFDGGKWKKVEKFITWCFSSEEDITDFKKNVLLKISGVDIHTDLIRFNQWEEAERFFAWLGLSFEEINKLKKATLFHSEIGYEMFRDLMHSEEGDERFVDYGNKQEAIELLLRWYLSDKETVLEFNDKFKSEYREENKNEAVLKNFDLAIAQRLKDLDIEKNI